MEEWKEYKLSDVCGLVPGFAFKSKDFGAGADFAIKIKDIQPPYVETIDADHVDISNYDLNKLSKFIVHRGEFLLAMTGATIGKIGKYIDEKPAYVNQRVLKFKDIGLIDYRYLFYFLSNEVFQSYILNHIDSQSAQPNISSNTIGKYTVRVPSLKTQQQIAAILSSLDDKIECNRRINDNFEQQAQALFDKMFPQITKGDSTVGNMITPQRGKGLLSKNAIPGEVPVVAGGIEPATFHNVSNTTPPVLTIAASGANAGYINLWHIPVWSSDSSFIDSKMTSNVYFWYVMLKKRQKEIFDAQVGSAQPHIYPKHIAELPMQEVEENRLLDYNRIVTPVFKQIGKNVAENNRLASIRDVLLPKLMSGELKIS